MSGCVHIVIVNFRTAELVVECLRSLATQAGDLGGGQVSVIDNASGDGSVPKLTHAIEREGWSSWAQVMPQDRNGGFSFGNNAGIRSALASSKYVDYVLLLNPDTIARPGAVKTLVDFMDAHPNVGIAGSLLENAAGGVDCSAHRDHSPLSELDTGARLGLIARLLERYVVSPPPRNEAHACDWVSGASMMIRREVFEQIGLMDEGYFLYFEEMDFCCQARTAGWSVWYLPGSRVVHLEGASTGIQVGAKRRAGYWYDSRRRFFIKHHGIAGLLVADSLWALGRISYLFRQFFRLGSFGVDNDPKWFMFDLLLGDLRALLNGQAKEIQRHGIRR